MPDCGAVAGAHVLSTVWDEKEVLISDERNCVGVLHKNKATRQHYQITGFMR